MATEINDGFLREFRGFGAVGIFGKGARTRFYHFYAPVDYMHQDPNFIMDLKIEEREFKLKINDFCSYELGKTFTIYRFLG